MVSIKAIKSLVTTPFLQNILMFLKVPLTHCAGMDTLVIDIWVQVK